MSQTDFDLFDNFNSVPTVGVICQHKNKTVNGCQMICEDCGIEVSKIELQDKEWRYYGHSDTRNSSDPSRCQTRYVEEDKNIFKDIEGMGFSDEVVKKANENYVKIIQNTIHRGNTRKGIIFACIFEALKILGRPQPAKPLGDLFGIDNKTAMHGVKTLKLKLSKDCISNEYITPEHIIDDIMNEFGATIDKKSEVKHIYLVVKGKSDKLNRSRPQSIAAGLIYYWLLKTNNTITLKQFSERVKLRDTTILNISKEVKNVLEVMNP